MAEALIIEFDGADRALYDQVNGELDLEGKGWPAGLLTHTGGPREGGLTVFEVWESKEAQGEFMTSRLGPALQAANAPAPARIEWLDAPKFETPGL